MLSLERLRLTQDGFRLPRAEIDRMVDFVRGGGAYYREALLRHDPRRTSLIAVTRFEDGELFLRDGLHRAASIHLAGRDQLLDDEYVIEPMTYAMFREVNLAKGWFTPHDPRLEVRRPELDAFKRAVRRLLEANEDALEFIRANRSAYCVPRQDQHAWIGGLL